MVESFFSGGNSAAQDNKGKMKYKTKCDEKLITCVKAIVDEDAQITIQEKAEFLDISLDWGV